MTEHAEAIPFAKKWFEWDALYDDAAIPAIQARYPQLVVEDARDGFHPDRVCIEISGVTNGEFYKFAVQEGFAGVLLLFSIQMMRDQEFAEEMITYARRLSDGDSSTVGEVGGFDACPSCGLFRKTKRVCSECRREGCEACVCDEGICMVCDLGDDAT